MHITKNDLKRFTSYDSKSYEEYLLKRKPELPSTRNKCFICGNKAQPHKDICLKCELEFPIKENKD